MFLLATLITMLARAMPTAARTCAPAASGLCDTCPCCCYAYLAGPNNTQLCATCVAEACGAPLPDVCAVRAPPNATTCSEDCLESCWRTPWSPCLKACTLCES
eukprot:COSAG03_NODE_13706_length_492_cov_0.725191_1_plen_102_part_10